LERPDELDDHALKVCSFPWVAGGMGHLASGMELSDLSEFQSLCEARG
jgi:hypothetical protein